MHTLLVQAAEKAHFARMRAGALYEGLMGKGDILSDPVIDA